MSGGDGQTLHFARSRAMIDFLLEHGADLDAICNRRSLTAIPIIVARPHNGCSSRNAGADCTSWRNLVERGVSADIFLAAALGPTDRLRDDPTQDAKHVQVKIRGCAFGIRD